MGLLEKYKQFKKNRLEKAVAKNLKTILNAKAIKDERAAAIDFFCTLEDTETAVRSLLKRFDYSLEHGINDTREKETAMAGILSHKDKALPFVHEHLKATTRIAWPIKIFQALASEPQIVEALEACLEYGDVVFDQIKIDKNYDILCYLRDHSLADKGKKLLHFTRDADERVRFSAVETILSQKDLSIIQELEPFLLDVSSENTRIHQAIVEAYVDNKWTIQNKNKIAVGSVLSEGIKVGSNYSVSRDLAGV